MSWRPRLAVLLFGGMVVGPVMADTPLPPPAAGEILVSADQQIKGQFAPPVAMPDGSVQLFNLDGNLPQAWRVYPLEPSRNKVGAIPNFTVPYGHAQGYSETRPAEYASVRTAAGVWLIGPDVHLLRPDGSVLAGALHVPRSAAHVVVASDGSLVVVGGASWPEARQFQVSVSVERVRLDRQGRIVSESMPAVPVDISHTGVWESLSGYSLLALDKGRIMLAGSEYRNLTLLYDPATNAWQTLTGMAIGRSEPALLLLSDGRVWASGGDGQGVASTSEIWSPVSRAWSPGPGLPVPMRGHSAIWSRDKREALLAGGYFPAVLGWEPGDKVVRVAARLGMQRNGAGVLVLDKNRLALASGIYARNYDEAWGRRSPGTSIVPLDGEAIAWPMAAQGAMAVRNGQLLTAGGIFRHSYYGSEDRIAGRSIELQDLRTGRVSSRTLPVDVVSAQAGWLDDSRVLINAESDSGGGVLQWLGVFNTDSGEVRPLTLPPNSTYAMSDGVHRRMRLIGAHAGLGWLVSEESDVYRVDAAAGRIDPMPRLPRKRTGLVGRVLDDGRLVVAGGEVESEWVAARQENCVSCPVTYQGYGPLLPSRRYDIFNPETREWQSSAPSRGAGKQAAVLASGRVVKLGLVPARDGQPADSKEGGPALLEVSDSAGRVWSSLTPPASVATSDNSALRSVVGDGPYLRDAVFLGVRADDGGTRWYWLDDVGRKPAEWRELGQSVAPYGFPPGELATGLKTDDGKALWLVGGDAGVAVIAR